MSQMFRVVLLEHCHTSTNLDSPRDNSFWMRTYYPLALCKYLGRNNDRKVGEDCKFLHEICPTCKILDRLCHWGMDSIVATPLEHCQHLMAHLQRRVDHFNKRASYLQIASLNWKREANLASTFLFHWRLSCLVHRCTHQPLRHQPPVRCCLRAIRNYHHNGGKWCHWGSRQAAQHDGQQHRL